MPFCITGLFHCIKITIYLKVSFTVQNTFSIRLCERCGSAHHPLVTVDLLMSHQKAHLQSYFPVLITSGDQRIIIHFI